jgi:hypothetical protein
MHGLFRFATYNCTYIGANEFIQWMEKYSSRIIGNDRIAWQISLSNFYVSLDN